MKLAASSFYSTSAPEITGSRTESDQVLASGGDMETDDKPQNPVKSVLIMFAFLVGIRMLWEVAGE